MNVDDDDDVSAIYLMQSAHISPISTCCIRLWHDTHDV